jgi:NitT/TauT family transport system ATP-binding protein
VLQNVLLPAEVQHVPTDQAKARARRLLGMVGLAEFEAKYPGELSGGMQQRAAISRALINDPASC